MVQGSVARCVGLYEVRRSASHPAIRSRHAWLACSSFIAYLLKYGRNTSFVGSPIAAPVNVCVWLLPAPDVWAAPLACVWAGSGTDSATPPQVPTAVAVVCWYGATSVPVLICAPQA